jgi:nucleotide-binding universal stress UspA family protein
MIEINRILCPIDFSAQADHALVYAMKMAARYEAALHVLHVMPSSAPAVAGGLGAAGRRLIAHNFTAKIERWRQPGVEIAGELLEATDTAEIIRERADALAVDLIVTGSHGREGIERLVLGSVVDPLVHRCRQPVLVIPAALAPKRLDGPATIGRILCAVDFSPASLTAFARALAIAEEADANLTLLNVIQPLPESVTPLPRPADWVPEPLPSVARAQVLARLRALVPRNANNYCTVHPTVLEGRAWQQILGLAERQQSDLIVLGVHGRSASDLLRFGSNSRNVINHAQCPVLVVPAGHREPVHVRSQAPYAEPAQAT